MSVKSMNNKKNLTIPIFPVLRGSSSEQPPKIVSKPSTRAT